MGGHDEMATEGEVAEEQAPPPVFHLTDKDEEVLAMRDEDYKLQTWDELRELISSNSLHLLTRLPSQLRKYLAWSADTKREYGNMTNFILENRVCWHDYDPSSLERGDPIFEYKSHVPFADPADYRILLNDWPYGLAPGIQHVVVWLKVRLPVDMDRDGDLTDESRKMVNAFVKEKFERELGVEGRDQVMWFKNWVGLQSVRGLEHVHVLVRDVPMERLSTILERPWEGR